MWLPLIYAIQKMENSCKVCCAVEPVFSWTVIFEGKISFVELQKEKRCLWASAGGGLEEV